MENQRASSAGVVQSRCRQMSRISARRASGCGRSPTALAWGMNTSGSPLKRASRSSSGAAVAGGWLPASRPARFHRRFRELPGGGFSECRTCTLFAGWPGREARLRRFRELSRRRLGFFPIRSFGRIQQAQADRTLPPVGTHQSAQTGESCGDPSPAFGKPAAETPYRPAHLPDLGCRSADLSVRSAKRARGSDHSPAEIASGVSDPDRSPRDLFPFGRDLADSLPRRGPVLPEVSVGLRNPGKDPADPDPESAEPRPGFPEPRANGVESGRRLFGWFEEAEGGGHVF